MTNRALVALALALLAVAWLFAGPLFLGHTLYYRDVTVTYYPDLVFVARALRQGVWPLWHPGADGGAPFLMAYPLHLLLLLAAGPRATLALSPPLHLLLAMAGAFALARRRGASTEAAAVAGGVFGLSGWMLGSVLYPVFLAAAWAPLAIERFLALADAPSARRVALLAMVLAVQVTTLGLEAIVATAVFALVLLPRPPARRATVATGLALLLAGALAAPALCGALALLRGTARASGFAPAVALSYSAPLPVLLEALLPRFLGDVHTFTDAGFWGQPFYPGGSPFYLSLYLGPIVLLLAARAGARAHWRLWVLVALGTLISLGAHGPLGPLLAAAMGPMRVPLKFFFLSTLGLSLLAAHGTDRAREGPSRPGAALLPGVALLTLALVAALAPSGLSSAVSLAVPAASGPLARDVIASRWPLELAVTGAMALGAGLALLRGRRLAMLAALLALLDLVRVNGELNPSTGAAFFDLRPEVARVVEPARAEGPYRWFSFGVAHSPPLHWSPAVVKQDSDAWLFYLDRQSLLPRTQVLDGLDGAFDVDRMGLAPAGSTLAVGETGPSHLGEQLPRLRLANVRWLFSFVPLPEDRLLLRDQVRLPEVAEALRLYELRDALPRAFWVPRAEQPTGAGGLAARLADPSFDPRATVLLDGPAPAAPASDHRPAEAKVEYEAVDAHTIRIRARTPAGYLVVLDGFDSDWVAAGSSGRVPVLRADGRYRAVSTPGGDLRLTLKFRPRWRFPALLVCALALVAAGLLCRPRSVSHFTGARARRVLDSLSGYGCVTGNRTATTAQMPLTALDLRVSIWRLNS